MQPSTMYIAIPSVSLFCYCILLVVLLRSRRNKATKMYTLYISAMIIWSFGSLIMRTNIYPGPIFYNRILCIGLVAMPIIFYHFTLLFTETYNNKKRLCFGYISAAVLIILNFMGLIISDAYAENNIFYYKLGPAAPVVAVWALVYSILAFINITGKVRAKDIPFNRVKFVIYGLVLVIIGGVLNLIPEIGRYPVDIASNTVNALLITYSIYRYKFLAIRLIIKKSINYLLYTLILAVSYVVVVFVLDKTLKQTIGYTTIISGLVMAFIIAFAFQPLHSMVQSLVDRVFYRDKLYQQTALRDFSKVINNILDLNELSNALLLVILRGLQPKIICLMLRRNDEYYIFKSSGCKGDVKDIIFSRNHPVIQWFESGAQILTIEDIDRMHIFKALWGVEKRQLKALGAELFIPVKLRDELTGLLVLSERQGGEPYTQDDIELLFTLVSGAAVAIENARLYLSAREDAVTDGLTGLYNHRYLHETLERIIGEKSMQAFSVIMMDIDLFKLYNDLYGHFAGDKALMRMGEILRRTLRKEDIIARYGGEEFTIILPGLNGEHALQVAERVRTAVEQDFNSFNDMNKFLTVSAGVACYPAHAGTREELLKYADAALYTAKRNGRNQTVLYSQSNGKEGGLSDSTKKMQDTIDSTYFSAVYALAAAIDAKDHYTYGHSENVSKYAVTLAIAAGIDDNTVDTIKHAGLLHDIGKIGVPEGILTKAGKLTKEEMDIMKKHVDISITIIKHIPSLIKVIPAILCHHERYDGNGYPRGVKGENIPLEARCLCIADSFDSMTSDRPYRKALSIEEAIEEIIRNSGTQFDPKLAEIFISLVGDGRIAV